MGRPNREKTVAALAAAILLIGLVRTVPDLFSSGGESAFRPPRIPEARGSAVPVEPVLRFERAGEEPLRDPFRVASAWRPYPPPRLGFPRPDPAPRLVPPLSFERDRRWVFFERERTAPPPAEKKDGELASLIAALKKLDAARSEPAEEGAPGGIRPSGPAAPAGPSPSAPPAAGASARGRAVPTRAIPRRRPVPRLAAAAASPPPAGALDEEIREYDVLVLDDEDGTRFEGFILEEDPIAGIVRFELKGRGIRFEIETKRVARITRRQSPEEVYRKKLARTSLRSAREQFELGRWCIGERVGLRALARKHIALAIHRDPTLQEAYGYFLDLASDKPLEDKSDEAIAEEAEIYVLARRAGRANAEIEERLAWIAERLGLAATAEEAYRAAIEAAGAGSTIARRARLALASILIAQGRDEEALTEYEALHAGGSDWAFVPLWEEARILVLRGAAGDLEKAEAALERAAQIQPDYPGVPALRGTIAARGHDLAVARERFLEALRLGPDQASLRADLGIVAARLGRFDEARELFALARARDPKEPGALLGEGYAAEARGDAEAALESYRAAAEAAPESPVARAFLASALARHGPPDAAQEELAALAKLARESAPVFTAFARDTAELAIRTGDLAVARRFLGYAVEHLPHDADLWLRIAHVALRSGDLAGAKAAAERADGLDPGRPSIRNVQGYLAYDAGQLLEAESLFRKVHEAFPVPRGRPKGPRPAQAGYAEAALEKIRDARTLEVWTEAFAREDGPEVMNGWTEEESFGIEIRIASRALVMEGEQRNEPDGVTVLERQVPVQDLERLEARLRVPPGTRVRAALRLENERRTGGVVLFRDLDGSVSFRTRYGPEWRPPGRPEGGSTGFRYDLDARWPDDGAPHVFLIRRTPRRGRFDLLLDGRAVAENLPVTGLGNVGSLWVGVSGQTDRIGNRYRIEVASFRIYRRKASAEARQRY